MRIYELGFILKPDLTEQDTREAVELVKQSLTEGGASIDKVDDWGKRRLAYRVRGFLKGHYVFVQYSIKDGSSLPKEIERRLRVTDNFIKFMTIRLDEDFKRVEKLKAKRAKRPQREVPTPAKVERVAPEMPNASGHPTPGKPPVVEKPEATGRPAVEAAAPQESGATQESELALEPEVAAGD